MSEEGILEKGPTTGRNCPHVSDYDTLLIVFDKGHDLDYDHVSSKTKHITDLRGFVENQK